MQLNEQLSEKKVERPVVRPWTVKQREQTVRNGGRWLCLAGFIWLAASIAAFLVLWGLEEAGFVLAIDDLTGGVIYFGIYFGSWLLIAIGGVTWFVGAAIRR